MKRIILAIAFAIAVFPALSLGQVCPGPGGCPGPSGPDALCFREQCAPVIYSQFGQMVIAESRIDGYPVIGWAGPCLKPSLAECPNMLVQAFEDLRINALRALRAREAVHP